MALVTGVSRLGHMVRAHIKGQRVTTELAAVNPCGVGRFAPLTATLAALVWRVGRGIWVDPNPNCKQAEIDPST